MLEIPGVAPVYAMVCRNDALVRSFRLGWDFFRSVLGLGVSRCFLLFHCLDENLSSIEIAILAELSVSLLQSGFELSQTPSTLAVEHEMFSHDSVRPRLLRRRHGEFIVTQICR